MKLLLGWLLTLLVLYFIGATTLLNFVLWAPFVVCGIVLVISVLAAIVEEFKK